MNLTTQIAVQVIIVLVLLAVAIGTIVSPRIRALEAKLLELYRKDTTPAERALIVAFIQTVKPLILSQLPGAEQAILESEAVKRATAYAAAHQINLTPNDVISIVKHEMAGAAAAAKAATPPTPAAPPAPPAAPAAPASPLAAPPASPGAIASSISAGATAGLQVNGDLPVQAGSATAAPTS